MIDFEKLILTSAERKSIKKLRRKKEMHESTISEFDSLYRYGFLSLAHPENVRPDGYGGFTTDGIYRLSDIYFRYRKYIRNQRFKTILKVLELLRP